MTTIEQARRRYVRYAKYEQYRRTSCYGCPHTGATTALAKRLDAASVALDVAQSVGRRWSAPLWLEEVAA